MTIALKNKTKKSKRKIILPWYTVLFYLVFLIAEPTGYSTLTLLAAALHEGGHLLAALLCRVKIQSIRIYPFGAEIRPAPSLRSYGKDAVLALAGGAVNLLCALLFFHSPDEKTRFFALSSLTLGLLNLLPVDGLDGGAVLLALLGRRADSPPFRLLRRGLSFLTLFLLWLGAVYGLLFENADPSLFLMVCFLFVTTFLVGEPSQRQG